MYDLLHSIIHICICIVYCVQTVFVNLISVLFPEGAKGVVWANDGDLHTGGSVVVSDENR